VTYQWQIRGDFDDVSGEWEWTDIDGETSTSLEIEDVDHEDNGKMFRCLVEDNSGATGQCQDAYLNVHYTPICSSSMPVDSAAREGTSTHFMVRCHGNPKIYYNWYHSDKDTPSTWVDSNVHNTNGGKTRNYVVHAINTDMHLNNYKCDVWNTFSKPTSANTPTEHHIWSEEAILTVTSKTKGSGSSNGGNHGSGGSTSGRPTGNGAVNNGNGKGKGKGKPHNVVKAARGAKQL
jgi:hypothetical protein